MFIPSGEMQVGSVSSSVSAISIPVFVFLCTHDSCSKSFWDSPLVEGPGRQVHPKTATFCLVLGFTPSWQPSKAHQSQNDFEQLQRKRVSSGTSTRRSSRRNSKTRVQKLPSAPPRKNKHRQLPKNPKAHQKTHPKHIRNSPQSVKFAEAKTQKTPWNSTK